MTAMRREMDRTIEILQILKGAHDGILVATPDMKVRWMDSAMERLAGISTGAGVGIDALEVVTRLLSHQIQRGDTCAPAILSSIHNRVEVAEMECRIGAPASERWFAYSSQQVVEGPLSGDWVVWIHDITRQKLAEAEHRQCSRDLAFLASAATLLAGLPPDADIFSVIGSCLHEVAPGAVVIVSAADVGAGTLIPQAIFGNEPIISEASKLLGRDVTSLTLSIPPHIYDIMLRGEIEEVTGGLEEVALGQLPGSICRQLEELGGLGAMHCIPFTWKGDIFGTAVILTRQGDEPINITAIDTFKNLASIALQRHQAEAGLRQSEGRFRALIEKTSDFILIVDSQMKIRFASPPIERIDGISPEVLVGRSAFDMMLPEEVPRAQELMSRLVETPGSSAQFEVRFRGPRGMHVIEAVITNLLDDPLVRGVVVNARDITDRKRAEEAIQHRNIQLATLNQLISVSASALSLDQLFASALATTLKLLNFDVGAVYLLGEEGKAARLKHHQGNEGALTRAVIRAHQWPFNYVFVAGQPRYIPTGPAMSKIEEEILAGFGVAALAFIPLTAESTVVGAIAVGSVTGREIPPDVRELLEAIGREIGAGVLRGMLHTRLEAANREANLYLDIISHDIRNANNVATMYTDLLVEMLEGEPRTYVRKLKSSIDKSSEILANVMTIRRIHQEQTALKPVDLDVVITEELENFPETVIRYQRIPCWVYADDLLPEVFTNLIGNAIKFGGPDIIIAITVKRQTGGNVLVTVADNGPGIPDNLKEPIFHRFERGQARARGEGLGLFICRTLIERYGGKIRAEDRVPGHPEKGAKFRFTLKEVVQ
jgi:PAS domain S-box-containing protein